MLEELIVYVYINHRVPGVHSARIVTSLPHLLVSSGLSSTVVGISQVNQFNIVQLNRDSQHMVSLGILFGPMAMVNTLQGRQSTALPLYRLFGTAFWNL